MNTKGHVNQLNGVEIQLQHRFQNGLRTSNHKFYLNEVARYFTYGIWVFLQMAFTNTHSHFCVSKKLKWYRISKHVMLSFTDGCVSNTKSCITCVGKVRSEYE